MQFRQTALSKASVLWRLGHFLGALLLTALLLVFLVATRLLMGDHPVMEIRSMEVLEIAAPTPPPPPPDPLEEPPPPPPNHLPKLELQLDRIAPPLKATLDRAPDLTMQTAMFELEVDPPKAPPKPTPKPVSKPRPPAPKPQPVRSTYSAGELDSMPRLLNSPSASYPSSLSRQGIKEGRVVLEIEISTSGRVSVRRVIRSSHSEFTSMATSIASRARFSTPTKNGTPVKAVYQWPLVLRP